MSSSLIQKYIPLLNDCWKDVIDRTKNGTFKIDINRVVNCGRDWVKSWHWVAEFEDNYSNRKLEVIELINFMGCRLNFKIWLDFNVFPDRVDSNSICMGRVWRVQFVWTAFIVLIIMYIYLNIDKNGFPIVKWSCNLLEGT